MPFKFKKIDKFSNPQPLIIETSIFKDSRGMFFEIFKRTNFYEFLHTGSLRQFNCSKSNKNVVRGLHYQLYPWAQGKLVCVLQGSIKDVFVDISKSSKSYLKHDSIELTAESNKLLYVPPGYAHGFIALEDNTIVIYGCTNEYNKGCERNIRWDDPEININWSDDELFLSEKDEKAPYLQDAEVFE